MHYVKDEHLCCLLSLLLSLTRDGECTMHYVKDEHLCCLLSLLLSLTRDGELQSKRHIEGTETVQN